MKFIIVILIALLVLLQYELWFGQGSVRQIFRVKQSTTAIDVDVKNFQDKNKVLLADINGLRHGTAAVEERARDELGMVKKGETFFQVVK